MRRAQTRTFLAALTSLMGQEHAMFVVPQHREAGKLLGNTDNPWRVRSARYQIPHEDDLVLRSGAKPV